MCKDSKPKIFVGPWFEDHIIGPNSTLAFLLLFFPFHAHKISALNELDNVRLIHLAKLQIVL